MGRNAYPTVNDMQTFLTDANVIVDDVSVLEGALSAGIAAFERDCGDRKMLADEDATTRYFTPPVEGMSLILEDDLATLESVVLQVADHPPVTLTSGVDYYPQPDNALARGKPIQRLDLSPYRHSGGWWAPVGWWSGGTLARRGSVHVTGRWGYGAQIPDDAWLAMLYAGLWAAGGQPLVNGIAVHPGSTTWTSGSGDTETFAFGAWLKSQAEAWGKVYCLGVQRYLRVTI